MMFWFNVMKGYAVKENVNIEVWMHKMTGNLVEYVPTTWIGGMIFYEMAVSDKPIDSDTPVIFDDDERFKPHEYESLGLLI